MSDDPLLGKVLMDRLKVLRRLGQGGMGTVYEVEHLYTKHHRALKLLHKQFAENADIVKRFVREAGVAGTLRSSYVVETFDAGVLETGEPYVLMEMLEGRALADVVEQEAPIALARVVRIASQLCEGLDAAHRAGIVHRDLKPENVFLLGAEGQERIKILDFGISKFVEGSATLSGSQTVEGAVLGTPYYMSPEQARGQSVDARTDVYALGVILYEMLSGVLPFQSESFAALAIRIHEGDYQPLAMIAPSVSPQVAEVVAKAMHRDLKQRYPSAVAVREALIAASALAGLTTLSGDGFSEPLALASPKRKDRHDDATGETMVAGSTSEILAGATGTAPATHVDAPRAEAPARPVVDAEVVAAQTPRPSAEAPLGLSQLHAPRPVPWAPIAGGAVLLLVAVAYFAWPRGDAGAMANAGSQTPEAAPTTEPTPAATDAGMPAVIVTTPDPAVPVAPGDRPSHPHDRAGHTPEAPHVDTPATPETPPTEPPHEEVRVVEAPPSPPPEQPARDPDPPREPPTKTKNTGRLGLEAFERDNPYPR